MRQLSGQTPFQLLYGGRPNQRIGRVGGAFGPWSGGRNGVSNFANGYGHSGGCEPRDRPVDPCNPGCGPGGSPDGMTYRDRVRYLQAAALAGQIPSIFLPVVPNEATTAGGAAFVCEPSSSVPLLVTRMEIESDIATFFDIDSFKITRIDMILGGGGVPGTSFLGNSTAAPIEDPILPAGPKMLIAGTNTDTDEHMFRAVLRGIDLTDWEGWLKTGYR